MEAHIYIYIYKSEQLANLCNFRQNPATEIAKFTGQNRFEKQVYDSGLRHRQLFATN